MEIETDGQRLALLRKHLGLSQGELAKRMGVGVRTIQELEQSEEPLRASYALAAEFISLQAAVEARDFDLATPHARSLAVALHSLMASPSEPAQETADYELAQFRAFLADVKCRITDPNVTVLGRVNDYGFRWEIAVERFGRPWVIGNWPKGRRPTPGETANLIWDRINAVESLAQQRYAEAPLPPSRAQVPWPSLPEFMKDHWREEVWGSTHLVTSA